MPKNTKENTTIWLSVAFAPFILILFFLIADFINDYLGKQQMLFCGPRCPPPSPASEHTVKAYARL